MLNLSGKIDQPTIGILSIIHNVARDLRLPYFVVGATARDLVLHYGYGVKMKRATLDLDFAIQIHNWEAYYGIEDRLIKIGFNKNRQPQRLISPEGVKVDLVPFGEIADRNSLFRWPPDNETEMDVSGFEDAFHNSIEVVIQNSPKLAIPVVSPIGLILLKVIAWSDRARDIRDKDAKDIAYLLGAYHKVDGVLDRLYEDGTVIEGYEWDVDLGSAHLLGKDSAAIASPETIERLNGILEICFRPELPNHLAEEMCSNLEDEYDGMRGRLEAFSSGFNSIHSN